MARRRRRKPLLSPRVFPYLIALVLLIAVTGVGYAIWRAQPAFLRRLRARTADLVAHRSDADRDEAERPVKATRSEKERTPTPASAASEAEVRQLKNEISTLREENHQLRETLQRTQATLENTSETLAQKNTELDDLKLRLLIRAKTNENP